MTSLEGAIYVRCLSRTTGDPSREAFLAWAKRRGLIPVYRGRTVLFAKRDIDAALNLHVVEAAKRRA